MMPSYYIGSISFSPENHLQHYGILGMKWGVRRYENKNGKLTAEGKRRYQALESKYHQGKNEWYVNQYNNMYRDPKSKIIKALGEDRAKEIDRLAGNYGDRRLEGYKNKKKLSKMESFYSGAANNYRTDRKKAKELRKKGDRVFSQIMREFKNQTISDIM